MHKEESGSNNYQIRHSPKFDSSYRSLLKQHYRKDNKAGRKFEGLIDKFLGTLEVDPCSNITDLQSFPSNTAQKGFELRKIRYRMPGLQGAAKYGRLLFVVNHPKRIVWLLWVFTHAEFGEPKGQPSDKELKAEINLAKQRINDEPSPDINL